VSYRLQVQMRSRRDESVRFLSFFSPKGHLSTADFYSRQRRVRLLLIFVKLQLRGYYRRIRRKRKPVRSKNYKSRWRDTRRVMRIEADGDGRLMRWQRGWCERMEGKRKREVGLELPTKAETFDWRKTKTAGSFELGNSRVSGSSFDLPPDRPT